MRVTVPIVLGDANLVSSTINEPDTGEVLWNAATNYALGTVVVRTTTHKKYENVLAGVDAGLPENTPLRWLPVGYSNRWAMLDTYRNSKSVKAGPVVVELNAGERADSIGVLGLDCDSVLIEMRVGGNLVYSHTEQLNTRIVNDWYDYFYADFGHINNFVLYDIPPYSNGIIKLTFTSVSTVEIGAIIVGKSVYLGKVTTSSSSDEVNNSRIDIKETGESILLPRKSAPKMNTSNVAEAHHLNKIRQVRKELSGVPAVWSGLDDKKHNPYFDAFLILGVFKQFYIKDPVQSHFQIDFEIVEIL